MTRNLSRLAAFTLASLAGSAALAQPVTLSVTSGTATITSQTQSGGAWTVLIQVAAGSPAVFTVTTATSNVVVDKIEVECDADCRMTVNESGSGTFAEIRSIVEKSTSSPESFEIERVQMTGTLGSDVANEGTVAAEVIEEIVVGGDLTAQIIAGPRAGASASNINLISVGGDMYSSISAEHGVIGAIDVQGNIWNSTISTNGLASIAADAIQANLNIDGPITRLECRSGDFFGGIFALALEEDLAVQEPGLLIAANFYGGIFVNGDISVPIEVGGIYFGELLVYVTSSRAMRVGETSSSTAATTGSASPTMCSATWPPTSSSGDRSRARGSISAHSRPASWAARSSSTRTRTPANGRRRSG